MSDGSKSTDATVELFRHIGFKGLQAGSVLGLFAVTPISAALHKRGGGSLDVAFLHKAATRVSKLTLATFGFTMLAGAGLIMVKEGSDQEKFEDRVYRLQNNQGQVRTDTFAAWGSVGGFILSALRGPRSAPVLAGGTAAGMGVGVLLHVATSQEASGSKIEAAKHSVENVAKEL